MLGIEALGFVARNVEEIGVELVEMREKTAASAGDEAATHGIFGVDRVKIVEALFGVFANGFDVVVKDPPEGRRVGRTGKAASDADNGNGLVRFQIFPSKKSFSGALSAAARESRPRERFLAN